MDTQILGERPDGARVLLELPANEDDVGFVVVEDGLRGLAVVDAADGRDEELVAERGLDLAREVGVEGLFVARRERLLRVVAGGRDIEEVDTALC